MYLKIKKNRLIRCFYILDSLQIIFKMDIDWLQLQHLQ